MGYYNFTVRDLVTMGVNFNLSAYPIYDENHRKELNDKIINHYMDYEIGAETPDLFIFQLNRKMNEIMPYYNEMYRSVEAQKDPFNRVITELFDEKFQQNIDTTGNQKSNSTSDSYGLRVDSDTPQSEILTGDIEDNKYADFASVNKANDVTDSELDTVGNTTQDYEKGHTIKRDSERWSESDLVEQFRSLIINIDMMIVDELAELFINLWYNPLYL